MTQKWVSSAPSGGKKHRLWPPTSLGGPASPTFLLCVSLGLLLISSKLPCSHLYCEENMPVVKGGVKATTAMLAVGLAQSPGQIHSRCSMDIGFMGQVCSLGAFLG